MELTKDTILKTAVLSPKVGEAGYLFEDGIFGVNAEITRKGFFGDSAPKC